VRLATVLVGTSGYSYRSWEGVLYPPNLRADERLAHYSQCFQTVELNVTFYRLPRESTFSRWYRTVPPHFAFALKGSRTITHYRRLREVEEEVRHFFRRARVLGDKLAVVLWQLPPSLRRDEELLRSFCELLMAHCPVRCAFEFRHSSWLVPEVFDLLREYNHALCVADGPRFPRTEQITADFAYLRLHGPERMYASSYNDEQLLRWADRIMAWKAAGLDVYVYFNNDAQGHAVRNARSLLRMLSA